LAEILDDFERPIISDLRGREPKKDKDSFLDMRLDMWRLRTEGVELAFSEEVLSNWARHSGGGPTNDFLRGCP
jgi:hypothetical protein